MLVTWLFTIRGAIYVVPVTPSKGLEGNRKIRPVVVHLIEAEERTLFPTTQVVGLTRGHERESRVDGEDKYAGDTKPRFSLLTHLIPRESTCVYECTCMHTRSATYMKYCSYVVQWTYCLLWWFPYPLRRFDQERLVEIVEDGWTNKRGQR